jgi:predicted amidohydrolase
VSTLRAGVFQCDGAGLSPARRLEKLKAAIDGKGLDLVICPELFLTGYNVGDELRSLAEPAKGALCAATARLAQSTGTAIVAGFPEGADDAIYNTAVCIDAQGTTIAHHRKLAIPPGFERDHFTPGDRITSFTLAGMKCALLICYDVEFPETVRAACEAGAEVILAPTALGAQWDQVAACVIPTRAFENGCYLVYANHAGTEGDIDYAGLSCIAGPDGRDVARAGAHEEMIIATLHADKVKAARERLPYLPELAALKPKLA